jgi:hypothetical protein
VDLTTSRKTTFYQKLSSLCHCYPPIWLTTKLNFLLGSSVEASIQDGHDIRAGRKKDEISELSVFIAMEEFVYHSPRTSSASYFYPKPGRGRVLIYKETK